MPVDDRELIASAFTARAVRWSEDQCKDWFYLVGIARCGCYQCKKSSEQGSLPDNCVGCLVTIGKLFQQLMTTPIVWDLPKFTVAIDGVVHEFLSEAAMCEWLEKNDPLVAASIEANRAAVLGTKGGPHS